MYQIAIVDDDHKFLEELQDFALQYSRENGEIFELSLFDSGKKLLENYQPEYDLILLDIEMPDINGMSTAEKIRQTDENVVIMFITNMAQYAIQGYSVGALDFVVKPVNYYTFSLKMTRALKRVKKRENSSVLLSLADGVKKLELRQIYYLEVQNRMLHYFTTEGEYIIRGTLQSAEKLLPSFVFARCNHWYLVNLMHVTEILKNTVRVGPYTLEISRRNRTAFLKALAEYMGGNS